MKKALFSDPAELPGLLALMTGSALVLTAILYFFAWNWQALPETVRLILPGAGTVLSLLLVPAAERRQQRHAALLALMTAVLFTGLFWTAFGQIFQSGATAREFCVVWAVSITPVFLLRPNAVLWNLLILLLCITAGAGPLMEPWKEGWTSHFLAPLLVSAAGCLIALLPAKAPHVHNLNAWLALPLTILLTTATAICSLLILFSPYQYTPSLPEMAAGPLALTTVLLTALYHRHPLSLCGISLSALVLLNTTIIQHFEYPSAEELTLLLTVVNLACTFLLSVTLPKFLCGETPSRIRNALAHIPALLGGLLSAISLMALTAFLIYSGSGNAFLLAGLSYMPCGVLLWHVRGKSIFVSVLASVFVTGGSLCFHIGLLDYSPAIVLSSVWAAAVILYLLLAYPPLRFSVIFWAQITTLFFLPSVVSPDFSPRILFFLFCFLPLAAAVPGRFPQGFLRPAAFACLGALVLISPSVTPPLFMGINLGTVEEKIAISIAALNLALLLRRQLPRYTGTTGLSLPELAAAVFLMLVIWYLSPLENLLALNLIAAGLTGHAGHSPDSPEQRFTPAFCDRPLIISGLFLLAASLVLFYYQTSLHFQTKMACMGIPGLCVLCAALWMNRRTRVPASITRPPVPFSRRQTLPFLLCAGVLTVLFCGAAADRNVILQEGKDVLLALTPQDPRAFMLGDYMALRYRIDPQLFHTIHGPGCLPLRVDESGRAVLSQDAFVEGSDCSEMPGPALRVEKTFLGHTRLHLPERYYFEEGHAPFYEDAAFAVLRFDRRNHCLLTGLADRDGHLILPPDQERNGEK